MHCIHLSVSACCVKSVGLLPFPLFASHCKKQQNIVLGLERTFESRDEAPAPHIQFMTIAQQ